MKVDAGQLAHVAPACNPTRSRGASLSRKQTQARPRDNVFVKPYPGREATVAGTFSRLLAIFRNAPRQIIAAYRKGYSEAPTVPPPEALLKPQVPPTRPKPPGKGLPKK
jgi:hypothetical protein